MIGSIFYFFIFIFTYFHLHDMEIRALLTEFKNMDLDMVSEEEINLKYLIFEREIFARPRLRKISVSLIFCVFFATIAHFLLLLCSNCPKSRNNWPKIPIISPYFSLVLFAIFSHTLLLKKLFYAT